MKASLAVSLTAAIAYGATAVAANFVVKHALLLVPLPLALLEIQLVVTFLIVQALRSTQFIAFPSVTLARARQHMGVSLTYVLHALLVMLSLSTLNIPMYNTLKRVTPVIVLTVKAVSEHTLPEPQLIGSVCLIVFGCVVAGFGDLSFSAYGYSLALTCACMQAAYMLLAERLATSPDNSNSGSTSVHGGTKPYSASGATTIMVRAAQDSTAKEKAAYRGLLDVAPLVHEGSGYAAPGAIGMGVLRKQLGADACEQLYYMGLLGVPAVSVPLLLSGHASLLPSALQQAHATLGTLAFGPWLSSAASIECFLTGTLLLCTHLNSALTTSIVAVLKSAVAVVLGFFFLGGVEFSTWNVVGICLNLLGGVWYSAVKCKAGSKPSNGQSR